MENIILNIIFYFLLSFLCFLMIAENYAKNKSNRIREDFTTFQQVINTDPFGRKTASWDGLEPVKGSKIQFNVLKYIDEGIKRHNTSTVQDVYGYNYHKYNSRSL